MIDKPLPSAVDVEKRVLSSIIQEPHEYIDRAKDLGLLTEHFYKPHHATIYRLMLEDEKLDLVTLTQKLIDLDILENMGGAAGVTDIAYCESMHSNFDAYTELTMEKYGLRSYIHFTSRKLMEAYNAQDGTDFLTDSTSAQDFITGFSETNKPLTSHEVVLNVVDEMERRYANPDAGIIKTPWRGLNAYLGGGV